MVNTKDLQESLQRALFFSEDTIKEEIVKIMSNIAFSEGELLDNPESKYIKESLGKNKLNLKVYKLALEPGGIETIKKELDMVKRKRGEKKVKNFVRKETVPSVDLEKEVDEYRKVRFPPKGVAAEVENINQQIKIVADQEGRKLQKAGAKREALNKFRERFVTKARQQLLSDVRSQVAFKKQVEEYRPRIQQRLAKLRGAPESKRGVEKTEGQKRHERNVARRLKKAKKEKEEKGMKIGKYQKNPVRAKVMPGKKYICTKNQKEKLSSSWLEHVRRVREENNCPTYKEALKLASETWIKAKHRK